MNDYVFDKYALYYNAFYEDKDYMGEAEEIKKILCQYDGNIKSIINFGCGTGNHDICMVKIWSDVSIDGIDISSGMIDKAKKNAEDNKIHIDFRVEDIRDVHAIKIYDSVISLFHVMSYQNENEDIINAFKSARRVLKKDGIFLFDVWYGPGVLTEKPSIKVKKVSFQGRELLRIATPVMYDKRNVVDVNYEIFILDNKKTEILKETHSMRYFFLPEIKYYLETAGFELVSCLDCKTLKETTYDSWTAYFVAKAI